MKQINEERLTIILQMSKSDGEITANCRADYEVKAEDLTEVRSKGYELSDMELRAAKLLASGALAKIKADEGV